MLNPRIYRAAFLPVVVAVMVLAFSFRSEPAALSSNLAPAAFNGQAAFNTTTTLAQHYPNRAPGSPGDDGVARQVAAYFAQQLGAGAVSERDFTADTALGKRTLEDVVAQRAGSSSGRIVVIASRDALAPRSAPAVPGHDSAAAQGQCSRSAPECAPASLSGTATLMELARVLAGRTLNRTLELISTSGSAGLAGASRLAGDMDPSAGPIDAVIVLGDIAGERVSAPVVVPWSTDTSLAPLVLRNTAAAAVRGQAGLAPGGTTLAAQFARLALPLTLSAQGPFNGDGIPAVLLSRGGERGPSASAPVSETALEGFGSAALQTITALDAGPDVPAPSAYLTYSKMEIPAWPIRLLIFTLILPVLCAAVDAFARARRRGHRVGRWALWVLATALPFALAVLFVAALGAAGLTQVAPPGPLPAGAVSADGGSVVEVVAAVAIFVFAMLPVRSFIVRRLGLEGAPTDAGGAAATLLVLCAISLVLWVVNPFAAALVVPALHLWMWMITPEVRLRAPAALALLLAGLTPVALVILYYATQFGLGPVGVLWTGTLLVAGGGLGLGALLEWSIFAGCTVSVAMIAARTAAAAAPDGAPVTIRGPVTYAGPGSLGGTKSALRR